MQKFKTQVLTNIKNDQVRKFIQDNIFSNQAINYNKNAFLKNYQPSKKQLNSSSMFSSYISPSIQVHHAFTIKSLVGRLENMIVMNGFYKNVDEIKELRRKIKQLKKQNEEIQERIKFGQRYGSKQINEDEQNKKMSEKQISLTLSQKIRQTEQKLKSVKAKQYLLHLVKLSPQQKEKMLEKAKLKYQSLKNHIEALQKVVQNISRVHPQQAWIKLQLQQIQQEYDYKNMLLGDNGRLDVEIQILQLKLQKMQKQIKQKREQKQRIKVQTLSQNKQNDLRSKVNIHIPDSSHSINIRKSQPYSQEHTPINSSQKTLQNLLKKLNSLQIFINEEQQQKACLLQEIGQFNTNFSKQKNRNQQLLSHLQDNFFQSPSLIDEVMKLNDQDSQSIKFLVSKLMRNRNQAQNQTKNKTRLNN